MAVRDRLNVTARSDLYNFVMQNGQVIDVLGVSALADIAIEAWYYDSSSTAIDNGTTVIQPTAIISGPGRYLIWIQQADFNYLLNAPNMSNYYLASNPNGYISSINSGNVTTALGYTPVTNARTMTVNGVTQDMSANRTWTLTTTDVTEGTNLYYTAARFNTAFSAKSTTDLAEGTNLYYTATRFNTAFSGKSTTDLSEGTRLYYTDARARAAISITTTGTSGAATYNNSTGVLNVPNYTFTTLAISAPTAGNSFTSGTQFQPRAGGSCAVSVQSTLGGIVGITGTVTVAMSATSGGTYTTVSVSRLLISVLAVTADMDTGTILVPSGWWVRITLTGGITATYTRWDV